MREQKPKNRLNLPKFVLAASGLYAGLATAFSMIGLLPIAGNLLPTPYLIGNPLEVSGISVEHVVGHIVFGMIAGIVTLSVRYLIIAGLFPIALDADHLIQFLNLEAIPRMGHSFVYAVISVPIMMYVLGKRDYRLGAISLASVLTHVSFDVLLSDKIGSSFPILIPFSGQTVTLIGYDWILFLAAAAIIIGIGTFIAKKPYSNKAQI
ncbi:hypothetical protein [Candidatus Nitrosotenuis cloacae]|uniref:Uncharacterized protein n=1 Tax=Candidatus Nitrosotenuis cloacae TaxID=1603555 RepID=A0A3G1B5H7_9ARCH|nr:hypothetical protein [Candidatus Nitrosotenuis cloacae]AJZ76282.1 hypothetical protein SU86_007795 [Candidatus Nitrosotenuis cloacae]